MVNYPKASEEDPQDEIAFLVRTLHETQKRLQELAGGEVDVVVHPDGYSYLLHEAQEGLLRSEKMQREFAATQSSILNALPAHIALLDEKGVIISVNEGWRRFAKSNLLEELAFGVGLNYLEICDSAMGKCAEESYASAEGIRSVLSGASSGFSLDYPCHSPTEQRWFRLRVNPMEIHARPGAVVMHLDITESKLAEQAVRASEVDMAAAQSLAHFGSWRLDLTESDDLDSNALHWSDEMYRIAGFEPGEVEVSNELFFRLIPEDEHEAIRQSVADAIRERGPYSITHRLIRHDGEERIIHEMARVYYDVQSGQPLKMVGTAQDITERKRADLALHQQQTELKALFDLVPAMIWFKDTQNAFLRVNQRVAETTGMRIEEIEGKSAYEIFPEQADAYYVDDLEVIRSGVSKMGIVEKLPGPEGQERWVQTDKVPVCDEAGNVTGLIAIVHDITERKRAEHALRDSEQRFRFLNDLAEATRTLAGPAQVMAVTARMLGEHLHASRCAYADVERDGESFAILHDYTDGCASTVGEYRLSHFGARAVAKLHGGQALVSRNVDAELLPHEGADMFNAIGIKAIIACPLVKEDGLRAMIAVHQETPRDWQPGEITLVQEVADRCWATIERRRAETALKESEQRFAGAFEFAPIGVALVSPEGRWLKVNKAICDLVGYSDSELLARTFQEITHPDDLAADLKYVRRLLAGKIRFYSMEKRYIHAHGHFVTVLLNVSLVRDGEDQPVYFISQMQDITKRKQAEGELRLNEQRYRTLVEATTAIVWDTPASGVFEVEQPSWSAFTGQTFEEYRGWGWLTAVHPEDRNETTRLWMAAVANRSIYAMEHRLQAADGSFHNMQVSGVPLLAEDGTIRQWTGIHTDITERKRSEERIAEQASLIDQSQDAIILRDLTHRVIFWNKGAERLYGWTAEEAVGRQMDELIHFDRQALHDVVEALREQDTWAGEMEKVTKTGVKLTLSSRWTLLRDVRSLPQSILVVDTDITERKQIETQFYRAQRMESIGTLAGGLAHDLNNVLTPILMAIDLLRMKKPDPASMEILSTIGTCSRRAADMVGQVLSFARGMEGRRIKVSTRDLIREIEQIAQDTFLKSICIVAIIPEELSPVLGDPTQLHQVLLNLCVNARDAMPDGGKLTISGENLELDAQYLTLNPEAKPGAYVCVQIEDNGAGMSAALLENIFEPFFTTKEVGKGTGLGLSTSRAIVKSHGGFMRVRSEEGNGTKFQIYLPVLTESPCVTIPAESATKIPRGHGELILVIDDEAFVREITQKTLEAYGYRVILASDGTEAVAIFAIRSKEISAVLTDINMPVMDGRQTIRILLQMDPDVRIIAASGLSDSYKDAHLPGSGVTHFLHKPFTGETLLTALHDILKTV
jgi:PAS domain S-box-containing protein